MLEEFIIAIDQSTSNSKVLLVDVHGTIRKKIVISHRTLRSKRGRVEQNAEEIFKNVSEGLCECVRFAREVSGKTPDNALTEAPPIISCGISNQTAAFVLWEKETGWPVTPLIGWQDSRGQETIEALSKEEKELILTRTGSELSPYVPASKLPVVFKESPVLRERAEKGEILFGTVDTWLIWKLTGGKSHRTDHGNACITQMMNIYERQWDKDVLRALNIPASILPEVTEAGNLFGYIEPKAYGESGFGFALNRDVEMRGETSQGTDKLIPITGVLGDSNAALYAQGGFAQGSVKVTYGTGASVLINIGHKLPSCSELSRSGLFPVTAWQQGGVPTYVLEGTIMYAGAALTWLSDEGVIGGVNEIEELAKSVTDSSGVRFDPPLAGDELSSHSDDIKACFSGVTENTSPAQMVRALFEGIASQVATLIEKAECLPVESPAVGGEGQTSRSDLPTLYADGGMAESDLLLQIQAVSSGCQVIRRDFAESSALGVAFLSGLSAGVWSSAEEALLHIKDSGVFEPLDVCR